jgi:hypothetical protein
MKCCCINLWRGTVALPPEVQEVLAKIRRESAPKLPATKDKSRRIVLIESMRTRIGEIARDCDRLAKRGSANGCHSALLKLLNKGLEELESWEDHLRE